MIATCSSIVSPYKCHHAPYLELRDRTDCKRKQIKLHIEPVPSDAVTATRTSGRGTKIARQVLGRWSDFPSAV